MRYFLGEEPLWLVRVWLVEVPGSIWEGSGFAHPVGGEYGWRGRAFAVVRSRVVQDMIGPFIV